MRSLCCLTVAVGVLAVGGATASAATLGFKSDCCYPHLMYTAAQGEANHLTAHQYALNGINYVTFSDPGNRIKPDLSYGDSDRSLTLTQCLFLGDHVTCQDADTGWEVRLGDKDDSTRFDVDSSYAPQFQSILIFGGDGNDTLRGGTQQGGSVMLFGQSGADRLLAGYDDSML